jgi:hypothetical protein
MSSTHETPSQSYVIRHLDAVINLQAITFIFLQDLVKRSTEIPDETDRIKLPKQEVVHRLDKQVRRLAYFASAREQAEWQSAAFIHPTEWASFALEGFRRIEKKRPNARDTFRPPLFTEARTDMQRQIFEEMMEARVFAPGESPEMTGREYALMVVAGRVALSHEGLGHVPVGIEIK